jgi:4-hydroxythreonine-4-phosphate dehydrogenase
MNLPRIGITLGDPGGVGPETVFKALSLLHSLPKISYVLFGSSLVVEEEMQSLDLNMEIESFDKAQDLSSPSVSLLEIENPLSSIIKGSPSKENGKSSFLFFERAVEEAQKGTIQALVTAPISKHSWNLAGLEWSGHTNYLSQLHSQALMTFWSDELKVALFSHHLPLKRALEEIKKESLQDFFLNLHKAVGNIKPGTFHFLVAGLNPHAGEQGLFGSEEQEEIIPAITYAQKKGMGISGPYPPDVVFRMAMNHPEKIVISLFHDQGLIPFKLLCFEKGVNVTLGLPFIRTSPDHGTAFDIAGKGKANPDSMVAAINLAFELSSGLFELSP